ncbi:MAG: FKBP-type peptidyl-prolyl cis-trans isomerase [Flavisolibacter sp.]
MKKIIVALSAIAVIYGCSKSSSSTNTACNYDPCALKAPSAEVLRLKDSISYPSNTTQHCSGLLYQIIDTGKGKAATPCSIVNVTYIGRFNDSVYKVHKTFDSATVSGDLSQVIPGWRDGLPLIKEGGHILLYIPPSLGYGSQDYLTIPGNSNLYFDVTLKSVQ